MTSVWKAEPAVVRGIIVGVLAIVSLIGVNVSGLDGEAVDAITGMVVLVAPLIVGLVVRPAVKPVEKAATDERAAYLEGLFTPVPADPE